MADTIDLSDADIDLLMEGLDAIASKEHMSEAMMRISSKVFSRGDKALDVEIQQHLEAEEKKYKRSVRERNDAVILMKAKLVRYRQARNAADFGEPENRK